MGHARFTLCAISTKNNSMTSATTYSVNQYYATCLIIYGLYGIYDFSLALQKKSWHGS